MVFAALACLLTYGISLPNRQEFSRVGNELWPLCALRGLVRVGQLSTLLLRDPHLHLTVGRARIQVDYYVEGGELAMKTFP